MKPIKKIVIAGGGTAGWMAAAMMAKTMGKNLQVTLVESDAIPTVGVGEATIPPLTTFHNILDIDEREFMATVNGTFKLGISFENWREKGHKYIHSFGYAGKDCWACSFVHFWLAGKARGIDYPYADYCAELLAAYEGKFAVLPNGRMNYAYHMDAGRYAKYLRSLSEKLGAKRHEGKIEKVNIDKSTGDIHSLLLQSGETIEGDFFIDCTGFRALLIEQSLHAGFEDWSHWLPCDRALAVQTKTVATPLPYTRSIAHDAGWQWRIPLQTRVGNGLVYSSRFWSDEKAAEVLMANLEGDIISQPKPIQFRTGTRRKHWHKNCLALGLSSGFLEPLESTSIHLIQKSLVRFMQLLPSSGVNLSDVDEFNRQTKIDVERIRDFVILHYKVTDRVDSEFWRYCKNMSIPETLQQKIDLFSDSAKVFKVNNELFGEESWIQVMMGQGVIPKSYHGFADVMSDQELGEFLASIRQSMAQMVAKLPSHQQFIDHYCKMTDIYESR
ncbi:tryptophan 7-halogenase [Gilvimarinus sp. SDUM040013]|uniref:Tryptophan halogenase family protein n=1 Tax=Gilvimarinus gilvus TaxID=3058038 RepID=A0ABU4RUU9_9GAMM|nr:tryptophan halogenase family protein [Gilvimarinus sp. SDUM040013]MDO3388493.1 tryptophan 7-halogenase [Gilvimarinus sp. SDUM040013]MDX6848635.1 tryptophan halogenase family protein [Gilvimarinus sp. SDUM040013]